MEWNQVVFASWNIGFLLLLFKVNASNESIYEHDIGSFRETSFGRLTEYKFCKEGGFLIAISVKYQKPVEIPLIGWIWNQFVDDRGITQIEFECSTGEKLISPKAENGDWQDYVGCKNGFFISGFDVRVEEIQGLVLDDTAASQIKIRCSHPKNSNEDYDFEVGGAHFDEAKYRGARNCHPGYALCGMRVEYEEEASGIIHDDTGINNLDGYCCKLPNNFRV